MEYTLPRLRSISLLKKWWQSSCRFAGREEESRAVAAEQNFAVAAGFHGGDGRFPMPAHA